MARASRLRAGGHEVRRRESSEEERWRRTRTVASVTATNAKLAIARTVATPSATIPTATMSGQSAVVSSSRIGCREDEVRSQQGRMGPPARTRSPHRPAVTFSGNRKVAGPASARAGSATPGEIWGRKSWPGHRLDHAAACLRVREGTDSYNTAQNAPVRQADRAKRSRLNAGKQGGSECQSNESRAEP